MQSPVDELPTAIKGLIEAPTADDQRAALQRYFSPDASFDHSLCAVAAGPSSRDNGVLSIYQWLRIISTSSIRIDSVAFDQRKNRAYVDAAQTLRPTLFPVSLYQPTLRIVVLLHLHKGADGLFYIHRQEDFYAPQVLPGQLVPGLHTVILTVKLIVGIQCFILAWLVQTFLGYWKPSARGIKGGKVASRR